MRQIFEILIVLMTMTLCSQPLPAEEKTPANHYYPLVVGNQWEYQLDAGAGVQSVLTNRVAKFEKLDGIELARMETLVNGKVVATEHLRQTEDGIFRHRFNGSPMTPPVCLLKYPVTDKQKWSVDTKIKDQKLTVNCVVGFESVNVRAGKFKTTKVQVDAETIGGNVNSTYWFAKNVGMVKQTFSIGETDVLLELKKFTPAK